MTEMYDPSVSCVCTIIRVEFLVECSDELLNVADSCCRCEIALAVDSG